MIEEPYPGVGTTDRLERKFNTCRALLFAGMPPQLVRKYEAAFYMGAEAMFDLMADEVAELEDEEAEKEMSRLKNAIWRKASQFGGK